MEKAGALPPEPRQRFRGGLEAALTNDPFGTLTAIAKECGDIARLNLDGAQVFLVNSPDYIKEILISQHRNFIKAEGQRFSKVLTGEGLLNSEGELHHRERRLMQPAFHHERVASYAGIMVDYARSASDRWKEGQVVQLEKEMIDLTATVFAKALFDVDVNGSSEDREFYRLLDDIHNLRAASKVGMLRGLVSRNTRRFNVAKQRLDAMINQMIEERRKSGRDYGDLLSMLLQARDSEGDGKGMSDQQIRDEIMTVFLAAHHTTATATNWSWYFISQNPEIESRLYSEIESVLDGRPATGEEFSKLTYTSQVLTETLRILPPAWLIGRQAVTDVALGDYLLPAGSTFMMSQYVVHHDSRYFPDPDRFVPERWTPEFKSRLPKGAYFPFGAGPRGCIGEPLAWMEAVIVIATIAQRWRLRYVGNPPPKINVRFNLPPKYVLIRVPRPADEMPMRTSRRMG